MTQTKQSQLDKLAHQRALRIARVFSTGTNSTHIIGYVIWEKGCNRLPFKKSDKHPADSFPLTGRERARFLKAVQS
jgi:hypothetical protein